MVIALVLLFATTLSLSFIEDRLSERDKKVLYAILGFAMILIAGLREVGSTPDSEDYELMYYGKTNKILEAATEPSFALISSFLNSFSLGVNALFLTYALISIPIHLSAFTRLSKLPFLTLTIYISYYFMMHDMVQIRCSVAAALFLWAIYFHTERKEKQALVCILTGIFFHYSATVGLLLFLTKSNIPKWQTYILYLIVPIGLIAYFTNLDISYLVPDEFGGAKLASYRNLKDKGIEDLQAGIRFERNPLIWMNIILYYCCIYFKDSLTKCCKYVPVAIQVQALAFCFLFFIKGFSMVVGNRLNDYFSIASIILWTASVYAFYPQIAGKIISNIISSARFVASILIYALSLLTLT
ncbi:MAG: EpsG family protein [Prevotella sp.]|nr:EpsG family protein [Prevotella sp.]